MIRLKKVWRVGKFEVHYELEDGTASSFRCAEEMTMFIIKAWCEKNGLQDALGLTLILNKPCTVYDPITEATHLERILGREAWGLGRCKNCGADERAHLPHEG